jgi:hypothetical protein
LGKNSVPRSGTGRRRAACGALVSDTPPDVCPFL